MAMKQIDQPLEESAATLTLEYAESVYTDVDEGYDREFLRSNSSRMEVTDPGDDIFLVLRAMKLMLEKMGYTYVDELQVISSGVIRSTDGYECWEENTNES